MAMTNEPLELGMWSSGCIYHKQVSNYKPG